MTSTNSVSKGRAPLGTNGDELFLIQVALPRQLVINSVDEEGDDHGSSSPQLPWPCKLIINIVNQTAEDASMQLQLHLFVSLNDFELFE